MDRATLPFLLTAYGLPHSMGYLPTRAGDRRSSPLTTLDLANLAEEMGLAGIEVPLSRTAPVFDGEQVEVAQSRSDLGPYLRDRGLRLVADYGLLTEHPVEHLQEYLRLAAASGAKVVRAILSGILCGDRRAAENGWEALLQSRADRLTQVLPLAEDLGICIAVENHQDATVEDMIRLNEMTGQSPAFGVTLDTGNPLSVGEEPVETAQRLSPIIRHLHLKDYTIHFAPEGYRLVRCAAGDGVVDFPGILAAVRGNGHDVIPGIEIAAQATRTIPLLDDGWWTCHSNRPATSILGALRILWSHGRPAEEPFSSAWERGADSDAVAAEEMSVVRRSVDYFRRIQSM